MSMHVFVHPWVVVGILCANYFRFMLIFLKTLHVVLSWSEDMHVVWI